MPNFLHLNNKNETIQIQKLDQNNLDLLIKASELFYDKAIDSKYAAKFLANPSNFFYLAFWEDRITGFVSGYYLDMWQIESQEIFIYDLKVLENFRRKGIGKKMIQTLALEARSQKYSSLWVLAELKDERAKNFYKAVGGQANGCVMFDSF